MGVVRRARRGDACRARWHVHGHLHPHRRSGGGKVAGEGRVETLTGTCSRIRPGTRIKAEARGELTGTTLVADLLRIR
jgi:hypothetical protein